MSAAEKLDKLYYQLVEAEEKIEKAYAEYGNIPPVVEAKKALTRMLFFYEINYMLWECNVGMIE